MRTIKRWSVLALGWGFIGAGIILIPLPGPGILVMLGGLAVLSLESPRARWLLSKCRAYFRSTWPEDYLRLERFRLRVKKWRVADKTAGRG